MKDPLLGGEINREERAKGQGKGEWEGGKVEGPVCPEGREFSRREGEEKDRT